MSDWPRPFHPIVDGTVDRSVTVQVHPHLPGQAAALQAWCGGGDIHPLVNGGPVFVVPSHRPCVARLVGLGDVVVETLRDGVRRYHGVAGGDISAQLWPADVDEAPPAD